MKNNSIDYTFLRSELTTEISLIIKAENHWIGQDIEISIEEKAIKIIVNEESYRSENMPYIVINWYNNNDLTVYFANEEGDIISEITMMKENNKQGEI